MNKVSDVQIIPIKPQDGLIGFASFVFDDKFYMGSIGIHTRPNGGLRLVYPTRKNLIHSISVFHPINKSIATEIEDAVFAKFRQINGY